MQIAMLVVISCTVCWYKQHVLMAVIPGLPTINEKIPIPILPKKSCCEATFVWNIGKWVVIWSQRVRTV